MVQIVSIPHNGTHFIEKLLREHNIPISAVCHITESQMGDIRTYEDIIIPLRHPEDVAESWAKRKQVRDWDFMYNTLPTIPAHLFFLDDKQAALEKLSRHVNKQLKTDWTPENHIHAKASQMITEDQINRAVVIYNRLKGVAQ